MIDAPDAEPPALEQNRLGRFAFRRRRLHAEAAYSVELGFRLAGMRKSMDQRGSGPGGVFFVVLIEFSQTDRTSWWGLPPYVAQRQPAMRPRRQRRLDVHVAPGHLLPT